MPHLRYHGFVYAKFTLQILRTGIFIIYVKVMFLSRSIKDIGGYANTCDIIRQNRSHLDSILERVKWKHRRISSFAMKKLSHCMWRQCFKILLCPVTPFFAQEYSNLFTVILHSIHKIITDITGIHLSDLTIENNINGIKYVW